MITGEKLYKFRLAQRHLRNQYGYFNWDALPNEDKQDYEDLAIYAIELSLSKDGK